MTIADDLFFVYRVSRTLSSSHGRTRGVVPQLEKRLLCGIWTTIFAVWIDASKVSVPHSSGLNQNASLLTDNIGTINQMAAHAL